MEKGITSFDKYLDRRMENFEYFSSQELEVNTIKLVILKYYVINFLIIRL